MQKYSKKVCLSFDLEEWSIPNIYDPESSYCNNIEFADEGTKNIIKILSNHNIKATFFVTGYFAERCPEIIKKIDGAGHEVGLHSYRDEDHLGFSIKTTRDKIIKSKQIIEGITKKKIFGFRMPRFSVKNYEELWSMLAEIGFSYDSSMHPAIVPGYYYNFKQQRRIFQTDQGILEKPVSVIPIIKMPFSWIWMRNLGNWIAYLGAAANSTQQIPTIMYFHSWEFAKLPKIKNIPHHITRNCGDQFISQLDRFIRRLKSKGYVFMCLDEARL